MANSNGTKTLFKMFIKDCFKKLFVNEIFTTESINSDFLEIQKPFNEMDEENKKLVKKNLEIISLYNKDFYRLKDEYLSKNPKVNLLDFKNFINSKYNGYYYKKAIFLFIIKCVFLIVQIFILYLLTYPEYICVNEPINNYDEMFWIDKNESYKVIKVKRNKEFYFRMLSILCDFFFIINEGCVLYNLQRMKANVCLVLFFQILKYLINTVVIIFNFSKEICEKSKNNENIFYKRQNIFKLDIILIIYDLLKKFY
jgi:hypothetical protein